VLPLVPALPLLPAPLLPPLPLPDLVLPLLFVGRGFLPALGFRPADVFARGDDLPLPAPFLTVN